MEGNAGSRLHVSERIGFAVEHPDRSLPVSDGSCRRRIYSRLSGTCLPRRRRQADVQALIANRAFISLGGAAPAAVASRTPGTLLRDVHHAAPLLSNGDVWVCLSLVSDGGFAAGNLAGLSPGYCAAFAIGTRVEKVVLSCAHSGFKEHQ